jgi:hypothetical protein
MGADEFKGDTPLATDSLGYDRPLMHTDAMRGLEQNVIKQQLVTPDVAKALVEREWVPVIRRYDLTSNDSSALVELDALARQPAPDADTRAGWVGKSKAAMLDEYGAENVGRVLKDARAFVQQDPQLRTFAARGFGDHPQLVKVAARLGSIARKSGKLR